MAHASLAAKPLPNRLADIIPVIKATGPGSNSEVLSVNKKEPEWLLGREVQTGNFQEVCLNGHVNQDAHSGYNLAGGKIEI